MFGAIAGWHQAEVIEGASALIRAVAIDRIRKSSALDGVMTCFRAPRVLYAHAQPGQGSRRASRSPRNSWVPATTGRW
jgi:hypothetical protein